jgi:2-oxoisovalerate dehydrogenase E2 component (dihydrolipoyl transacylase)
MQQSKQISPHVLTVMEADMSRVVAHRAANKSAFAADGVNLTYTAYFMAAIAAALKAAPLVNSSWTEQGILLHGEINIGMATSLGEEGLIVPVLRRADELSLLGIARAVNDLATRARSKKLRPEEVRDGTFTLTNHGTGGSLFAMPIINQPQVGILGVGVIKKRAIVVTDADGNDAIAIRPMVYLSFVFDHRILDGASADAFLAQVKETLENGQVV